MKKEFQEHIETITKNVVRILSDANLDALLTHAGNLEYYHLDDKEVPFEAHAHFKRFTPTSGPGHAVLIKKDAPRPVLFEYRPDDYWEEQADTSPKFWRDFFDIIEVKTERALWEEISKRVVPSETAFVGNNHSAEEAKAKHFLVNPKNILQNLNQERSIKTRYEVACIREANRIGAEGHQRAIEVFKSGGSEYDIHIAYLEHIKVLESELPYDSIVALNEKAATLHYRRKRRDVENGSVLLVDAGARALGYASDITRTTATDSAHPVFIKILNDLNTLQQKLVKNTKAGTHFIELHHETHSGIAKILQDAGVLTSSPEESIRIRLTDAFLPHGLGHMLGLQVHDVGNVSREGNEHPLRELYPHIRTHKRLEVGNVLTIEPGIYFIPLLLDKLKASEHKNKLNWQLIDELIPCGGIRIEDNIHVTENGAENLTRPFLP